MGQKRGKKEIDKAIEVKWKKSQCYWHTSDDDSDTALVMVRMAPRKERKKEREVCHSTLGQVT